MSARINLAAATLALLASGTALTAQPAQAALSTKPAPQPVQLVSTGEARVEQYSLSGDLVAATTYGPETMGQDLDLPAQDDGGTPPNASGSGGNPQGSGCLKVTVTNVVHTLLGFTAYKFITWTSWCWTRSTRTISSVDTGWSITDVDSQYYWKGMVNTSRRFYEWSSGYAKSGYYHYRMGQFDNCVLKYGCIGTSYPENTLRSHSDGTWTWSATS